MPIMDVQKIASLAKLHIPDGEIEAFSRDMEAVLKLVTQLPLAVDGEDF